MAIPALQRWRQEGQEFKMSFSYIGSFRAAWANKQTNKQIRSMKKYSSWRHGSVLRNSLVCSTHTTTT